MFDTAAILDVLAGYEPGDATWAPSPLRPFASAVDRQPPALRIGWTKSAPDPDAPLDPLCASAVDDAVALLGSLGHELVEVDVPWQLPGLSELFGATFAVDIAHWIAYSAAIAGREPAEQDMEPMSWAILSMVRGMGAMEAHEAVISLQAIARAVVTALAPYDALLTPALAERPLALGTLDTYAPDPMSTFTRSGLFTPFTPIVNAMGLPAIALPLFMGDDGLPSSVQLIGRPAGEAGLLALAGQLEAAVPWAQLRSPVANELAA